MPGARLHCNDERSNALQPHVSLLGYPSWKHQAQVVA
jgi:hypothetical protein